MYARVTINFFAYDTAGSKGVGCGLGNVLKTRDGDALAGGASAASDFEGLGQSFAAQPSAPTAGVQYATPAQQAIPPFGARYAAPAQPQSRPAVNPITGMPW